MADADVAKVDVNAKADAPDASDASNIDTNKIDVKRGIGKPCAVAIVLYRHVSLRQQTLCDAQSYGEDADTGKFDAKKEAKKEATKVDAKRKSDVISTSRCFYFRQRSLRETRNSVSGGGEGSGTGGKETKQRRRVGEGGGQDRRRAVACAIAILREERGMIIGGIEVGHYGKITCGALARSFGLNGSITSVTLQVKNIQGTDENLAATLALTEEKAEKNYNEIRVEP